MDIALIGKAGAGKDSAAARLCEAHGYTRIAFADPLKEMALGVNPHVRAESWAEDMINHGADMVRLSDVVREHGWDGAKRFPEVRRLLQQMGQTVRAYDPNFWLTAGLRKWRSTPAPTVFTDVRYPNEALALADCGFVMVRIVRPTGETLSGSAATHDSETALDDFREDVTLVNDGTLTDLAGKVDNLLRGL